DQIPFDVTDPLYMQNYFDILHHPMEKQGVDFWWIDWQQGEESKIPGLDPLFWLNHLHWRDMETNPARRNLRPIMFSRYGGLGSHRYQIGFSGDTHSIWESLEFQKYFTATAGNVCYPFWSHDIGGHFFGPVDPELYARWIQFAVFNPTLRTHATKNPAAERRIWAFDEEIFEVAREAFHLRYELLPYIYSTAAQCHFSSIPMCRPLYYEWPDENEAYNWPGEYLFGDQMLVAPVAVPRDPDSKLAMTQVWIPPGKWHHWFTGKMYEGPEVYTLLTPLDEIPIFVKAGGIIPTMPYRPQIGEEPISQIILNVFPGEDGSYELYEDDGVSNGYKQGEFTHTKISTTYDDNMQEVVLIIPLEAVPWIPDNRWFEVNLHNVLRPDSVCLNDRRRSFKYNHYAMTANIQCTSYGYLGHVGDTVSVKFYLQGGDQEILGDGIKGRSRAASSLITKYSTVRWFFYPLAYQPGVGHTDLRGTELIMLKEFKENYDMYVMGMIKYTENLEMKKQIFLRMFEVGFDDDVEWNQESNSLGFQSKVISLYPGKGMKGQAAYSLPTGWQVIKENISPELTETKPVMSLDLEAEPTGDLQTDVIKIDYVFKIDEMRDSVHVSKTIPLFPSINQWWIIGPFENSWDDMLDVVHPPEKSIGLKSEYTGKDSKQIKWQKVERDFDNLNDPLAEFEVDFQEIYGPEMYEAASYALAYIDSPDERDAVLSIGSDDGVVAWVNGTELHRNPVGRGYAPGQDKVSVHLKKGNNTLLLKINQGWGGWAFSCSIEDENGNSLTDVTVGLEP
ncbi:DUF5110 domain-containing protein, partial [bacterium]|nr:DUF5110 domain-containing protein [bacterium]